MVNIDKVPQQQGAIDSFTGTTYIQSVASEEGSTIVARVTFEKGAHTFGTNMVVNKFFIS